eukprot:c6146_g1_i1.p1 GENE.c6146_g1_i1~~c6146_g1_i1.p1  ORF type:complete len:515 (-),score=154.41 c6146_g1_i1:170-1714(-)
MGRIRKRLSKRKTLKLKHKIEKKVRDSHKAKKKEESKRSNKPKKDLGIPNSYPFKEQELANIELAREKLKEEKERQKELRRKESERRRKLLQQQSQSGITGGTLSAADLLSAQQREQSHDSKSGTEEGSSNMLVSDNAQSRQRQKSHIKELKKMFEMADVLLEVLDARDPLGCRCTTLEDAAAANVNKKVILVLNKIDLVPQEAVQKWLKYLRQSHPTIAFKANTHKGRVQRSDVAVASASAELLSSSDCLGADTLVQLLKNYSRSHDMKKTIVVGVMGYPNVGKSSLINSLKRSKAVGVSPCPGFTRKVTEIYLDKNIKLLDCPGVVFDSANNTNASPEVVLRNAVAVEKVVDPIAVVDAIIKRCSAEGLARHYNTAAFNTAAEFLVLMAKLRGKLKRGGVVDLESAARTVLMDWNAGKIPFYTLPPLQTSPEVEAETVIVSEWAKEFDIASLLQDEARDLSQLPVGPASAFVQMEAGTAGAMNFDDDEEMDDNDSGSGDGGDGGDDDDEMDD